MTSFWISNAIHFNRSTNICILSCKTKFTIVHETINIFSNKKDCEYTNNAMETNEEEKILVKIKISLKTSWLNETRVVRQREIYIQRKTKLSRVLILPINFWKWIPHIYFVLLIKDQNKNSNSIKWLTKIISNPSIKGNLFCLLNTWKQLHSIIIISCDLFMMSSWKIKRKKKIFLYLFALVCYFVEKFCVLYYPSGCFDP